MRIFPWFPKGRRGGGRRRNQQQQQNKDKQRILASTQGTEPDTAVRDEAFPGNFTRTNSMQRLGEAPARVWGGSWMRERSEGQLSL